MLLVQLNLAIAPRPAHAPSDQTPVTSTDTSVRSIQSFCAQPLANTDASRSRLARRLLFSSRP